MESFIEAYAAEEPDFPTNVSVGIRFYPLDEVLIPTFSSGDIQWRGELHQGGTVTVRTVFQLPTDGTYLIGSTVSSSANSTLLGTSMRFYLKLEWGLVVSVSNTRDTSGSTGTLPATCQENC